MGQELVSVMIDEDITSEVRQYCYKNDIKIKKFYQEALVEKLKKDKKCKDK